MTQENYIKCSDCGAIIPIPAELYPEPVEGEIPLSEPYYCDECEYEEEDRDLFFENVFEEEDEGLE